MRLFILLFSFLFNCSVFAAAPVTWYFLGSSPPPLSIIGLTKAEACGNYASSVGGSLVSSDSSSCLYSVPNNPNPMRGYFNSLFLCPNKSKPDTSKPLDKQCPDPDPCQSTIGQTIPAEELSVGLNSGPPNSLCDNKCLFVFNGSGDIAGDFVGYSGLRFFVPFPGQSYKAMGSACSGSYYADATPVPTPVSLELKKGNCPGEVNGVQVFVKCTSASGSTGSGSTSSTTNPDGSTTKTESKSTTNCEGNSCTTTTTTTNTTTNPDGSTGPTQTKTETKTEAKETFCKQNPNFVGCVPSGFSTSSCSSAPTCTGDAIQCAIAAQQHKSYCDLMSTPTPISELGTNVANGELTPPSHPLNQSQTSPFNFAGAFNSSGGGGCPADVSIMDVVVPLSKTCDGLNALGIAALGISIIWAARIVFAG